jgi:serine/threonine protein kinase
MCQLNSSGSIGCIFGELLKNKPMLPGKNEVQQLQLICKLLGSPNEKIWPGFTQLINNSNNQNIQLPLYQYNNLRSEFPNLSDAGLNLLSRLLTYDPSKRITAAKALQHPYFKQFPQPQPQHLMPNFKHLLNNSNTANANNATQTLNKADAEGDEEIDEVIEIPDKDLHGRENNGNDPQDISQQLEDDLEIVESTHNSNNPKRSGDDSVDRSNKKAKTDD